MSKLFMTTNSPHEPPKNSGTGTVKPEEVPRSVLAEAILKLSDGVKQIMESGLNKRAIWVLLVDSTGVPITQVRRVLDGIVDLKRDYCS